MANVGEINLRRTRSSKKICSSVSWTCEKSWLGRLVHIWPKVSFSHCRFPSRTLIYYIFSSCKVITYLSLMNFIYFIFHPHTYLYTYTFCVFSIVSHFYVNFLKSVKLQMQLTIILYKAMSYLNLV